MTDNILEYQKKRSDLERKQNFITAMGLLNSCSSIIIIFAGSIILRAGFIHANFRKNFAKIIEITALITSTIGLISIAATIFHINKKKKELLQKLNSDQKEGLDTFKKFSTVTKTQNLQNHLKLTASIIFVCMEIGLVINLYKNIGLGARGKSPISISGYVDSIAISILLAVQLMTLFIAIKNYHKNKEEKKETRQDKKDIFIASISALLIGLNLVGKIISSMEGTNSLIIGKTEHGAFALGFTLRIIAVSGIAIISIYSLYNSLNTNHPNTQIKQEGASQAQPNTPNK